MICMSLQTEVKDMKAFHKFVAEKNRKRRMQLCADIEDELDDPSYVSCTPSGSEEEEVVSAPKVANKKRKEQDNPNPRKVKLPKLDPVRSPSPEFEHQQKKKEKTGVQKGKKRLQKGDLWHPLPPVETRRKGWHWCKRSHAHQQCGKKEGLEVKHKSCWYRHHVILFRKAHQPLQKQTIASTSAEPEAEVEFSDSKANS